MPLIRVPSNEPSSREKWVRAFEEAEASLRLEGMKPSLIFYELKERILAGEITADQAVGILMAESPSKLPEGDDWYDLRQCDPPGYYSFMESVDPKLKDMLATDPDAYYKRVGELETPENFVALYRLYQQRQTVHRLTTLGVSAPAFPDIPRRRSPRQ